jgi:methylisocitrate lyase
MTLSLALAVERPLQIIGVSNAYVGMMAEQMGFRALYLSGAGVANACYGLPDLGMTTLTEVTEEVRRIASATALPLLVDADTGWGHALNIRRCVQQLSKAGAAGIQIEDQVAAKRCGHRPGKAVVSTQEMVARIKAAVDARYSEQVWIVARTDAFAMEGLEATVARAQAYQAAGADAIFAEALTTLKDYQVFTQCLKIPVLANLTEFGKTPLFTRTELASVDVALLLYPLSAWRAMNKAAWNVLQAIRTEGSQQNVLTSMQTRDELYATLNYTHYEQQLEPIKE